MGEKVERRKRRKRQKRQKRWNRLRLWLRTVEERQNGWKACLPPGRDQGADLCVRHVWKSLHGAVEVIKGIKDHGIKGIIANSERRKRQNGGMVEWIKRINACLRVVLLR
jgi:hypothetical protein